MENSLTIKLRKEEESGEFICTRNPAHRFKLDKNGWLVSV
jgi:uncharacterized protein (DUF2342 family)